MRTTARLEESTRIALCVQSLENDYLPATVTNLGNGIVNVTWDNGFTLRNASRHHLEFKRDPELHRRERGVHYRVQEDGIVRGQRWFQEVENKCGRVMREWLVLANCWEITMSTEDHDGWVLNVIEDYPVGSASPVFDYDYYTYEKGYMKFDHNCFDTWSCEMIGAGERS